MYRLHAKSLQSCMQRRLCATLGTIAHQAPLSMGFSRQEYWSGLPWPPPGDLPNPGIELWSLTSSALVGRFFITSTTWEGPQIGITVCSLEHSITWKLQRSFIPLQDASSSSGWGRSECRPQPASLCYRRRESLLLSPESGCFSVKEISCLTRPPVHSIVCDVFHGSVSTDVYLNEHAVCKTGVTSLHYFNALE